MTTLIPYILLALVAGACFPIQAGVNARLSQWTGSPVLASTISFTVGTAILLILALLTRAPLPLLSSLTGQPWWMWVGGALGAIAVFSSIVLAPRLGAASMLSLILAGQMLTSLLLDRFGWVGYPAREIGAPRLLGAALVIIGIVLVQYKR